jgi:hypothetical protein
MRPEEQEACDEAWRAVLAEVLAEYRLVTGDASFAVPRRPAEGAAWPGGALVEGPALPAVVGALGPLDPPAVAALAIGVAGALDEIHAVGVVRGDLRPDNVLLGADGPGLRVADFSMADGADGSTLAEAGPDFDEPGFLAPEQALGLPIDPMADIFSLGAVLFYAASARLPFGTDEPDAVLYRVVHGEPELDLVPMVLRGLVKACLNKDPAQRPALRSVVDRAVGILSDAATAKAAEQMSDPAAGELEAFPEEYLDAVFRHDTLPPEAFPTQLFAEDDAGQFFAEPTPYPDDAQLYPEGAVPSPVPGPADTAYLDPVDAFSESAFSEAAFREAGFPDSAFPESVPADATQSFFGMPGLGPEPTAVIAPPQPPQPRKARPRRRRSKLVGVVTLGTVIVVGVAAAFLVSALIHPGAGTAARATPTPSLPSAPLPGTFLAGTGCAASPWSSTIPAVADNGGLEPRVGGGAPACGGGALAFLKSGTTAPGNSSYTWTFRLGWSSRCTFTVFTANADPSSGIAKYRLFIPSANAAGGQSIAFQINQGKTKGQWVALPALRDVALPNGAAQLTLTDAGSFKGDRFHVTASAVQAACAQVP